MSSWQLKAKAQRCNITPALYCQLPTAYCQLSCATLIFVAQAFAPGDDLIFQLESGFGLLRVLAVEEREAEGTIWHLLAYEELFPDVETAEAALAKPGALHVRQGHMALTDRAFERTPAARLGNRPVADEELSAYRDWVERGGIVSDRSALLMLGLR
ncbi:MAG: hypothetical protein QOH25_1026 [Acidobacteriota bacterium]|nr:hypothetical protein [Acidobacteriota bacterium]